MRADGGSDFDEKSGEGEKWLGSGCILEVGAKRTY